MSTVSEFESRIMSNTCVLPNSPLLMHSTSRHGAPAPDPSQSGSCFPRCYSRVAGALACFGVKIAKSGLFIQESRTNKRILTQMRYFIGSTGLTHSKLNICKARPKSRARMTKMPLFKHMNCNVAEYNRIFPYGAELQFVQYLNA